jgi:hypothetical protein
MERMGTNNQGVTQTHFFTHPAEARLFRTHLSFVVSV